MFGLQIVFGIRLVEYGLGPRRARRIAHRRAEIVHDAPEEAGLFRWCLALFLAAMLLGHFGRH